MTDTLARPTAVIFVAVLAIAIVFASKTQVDPDLWGHVRFGGDIVSAGKVLKSDPYSFTSDREWVNHEWLSEVIMFRAYSAFGQAGLVGLKMALVLGALGLSIWFFWGLPLPRIWLCLAFVLVCVATASTVGTIRPQVFSLFLFAVLLRILRSADRGTRWSLVAIPPLMALWVNLHGGWLVGMGTLGIWVACSALARTANLRDRLFVGLVGALAIAATLVNPYGPHMWEFLWSTVGLSRPDISEWLPVYRSVFDLVVWSATICFAGTLLAMSGRTPRFPDVIIIAMMAFLSFRVARLLPFLAISILLLVRFQRSSTRSPVRGRAPRPGIKRVTLVTVMACLPIVLVGSLEVSRDARCIGMDTPKSWAVPDGDAARYVMSQGLTGRMVTFFDWGQYAIWHFSPRLKVSMDGRRETVYSQSLTEAHSQLYAATASGLQFLGTLDADYVWLPTSAPAVGDLGRQGWTPLFKGPASVVFGRVPQHAAPALPLVAGPRCFPGP